MKTWLHFNFLEKVLFSMDYMKGTFTTWNEKGQKRVFYYWKF